MAGLTAAPQTGPRPDGSGVLPAGGAFAITAGATALARVTRGLYLGTAGDVTVTLYPSGDSVTFYNLAAGVVHPLACSHVTAVSGAVNIVGLV